MPSTQSRELVRNILTISFLISLPLIFFWRETLSLRTLGDRDAVFWFFPAYKLAAEQIKSGYLPLWNPYQYSGAPMFAEWGMGALDPINLIYLIETTSRALTFSIEISFAIALLATFSYTRSIGFNRRAAVISAVIYGLSGFVIARSLYPGFLRVVALSPFVLYFVEILYQRGRWRHVAGGALIIAWQVFAAHAQPLVYSSLLACAYALFSAFLRKRPGSAPGSAGILACSFPVRVLRRSRQARMPALPGGNFLTKFAVMFIAGIGLSAIQLFPAAEFAGQSVRRDWPYEMFTLHSLHPLSLVSALFPFFHGEGQGIYKAPYWGPYWHHNEAQIYLGAIALSLAIAGAIYAWRSRFGVGIFWICVALAGVILAFGKYSGPIAHLIYHVPVIGNFRSANRHWMEVTLAVAVLAGYAIDRLLRDESRSIARAAQIAASSLAVLCAAIGAFALWRKDLAEAFVRSLPGLGDTPQGFWQNAGPEFYLPMIIVACAGVVVVVFARSRRRTLWYPLLLTALIIDFYLYASFAPITNPARLETLIGTATPQALAAQASEREPFRYHILLTPAYGEFDPLKFYGSEMITGYDPVLNERYKTFSGIDEAGRSFISTLLQPQDQTLDLLNTRYVFAPPGLIPSDKSRWREITERSEVNPYRDFRIFENLRLMPRAWIVSRARVAYEGDQLKLIRGELAGQSFDPRVEALVDHSTAATLNPSLLSQAPLSETERSPEILKADILKRDPARILIQAETQKPSILVLSEIVYPGWRVKVDGIESELLRVNYDLRGVALSEGRRQIEFIYSPPSLKIGAVVSITTALILLIIVWREMRSGKVRDAAVV